MYDLVQDKLELKVILLGLDPKGVEPLSFKNLN